MSDDVEQSIHNATITENANKTVIAIANANATNTVNPTTTHNTLKQQHHQQHHQQQQQQHHHNYNNINSHNGSKTALAANAYYCNDTGSVLLPPKTLRASCAGTCVSRLLKLVFSTPGLVLLVVAYSVLGALIFPLLEAPLDITKSAAIAKSREDCLRELWIITEKLNVLYERNWTMLVQEQLQRFEGSIVAATRNGAGGVGGATSLGAVGANTAIGRFGGSLEALDTPRWSFSEALLYSVTVITTIGHGSLTPKTAAGKIATIVYALIGVPLMLMCLSSLGALLAEALQCTYSRICCRLTSVSSASHRNAAGRSSGKRQRRSSKNDDGLDEREKKSHYHSATTDDCYGQSNALDCKNCKYDAVMNETSLSNTFDYSDNGSSTMQRNEDSCQLLHGSPAKVNYTAPCMPVKATTMPANEQYYQRTTASASASAATPHSVTHVQQQQQQQQQQHQQPDVMLMATPTMTRKMSPQQQHQSPQHMTVQSHPALQTFHIVTASNASPALPPSTTAHHPTTLRQYATLQPQHTHSQMQRQRQMQLQQHFVAVPSSLIRFQPTAAATVNNAGTAMPPPTSVAVTAAATIYFPLPSNPSPATAATSTVTPAGVMCSQPLVKYHTIHLQPNRRLPLVLAPNQINDVDSDATATMTMTTTSNQLATATVSSTMPLPPPPAYQTATVHGVRRAKFLTKPLPPEINSLLAESTDVSCRHDLSQQANVINSTAAGPATAAATTESTTSSTGKLSASATTTATAAAVAATTPCAATFNATSASASTILGSSTTVDIMEDEEEHEQQRLGNCPHGTPSRVPLIATGNTGGGKGTSNASANEKSDNGERSTRSLINATAASFHRHTLHTFQRNSGARKSTAFLARRGCNMHTSHTSGGSRATMLAPNSGHGSGCYGDTTETSDDDEYTQHGSEEFVLEQLNADTENDDDNDDDEVESNAEANGPQVPISIVLLILVCYICLGTVIFAFWENWSLVDGAYFCFVTLSTIGYGDFLPERTFQGPEVQLFACCAYLLLGLVLVAMSFSILETQLMWKCKRIAVRLKLAKD